MVVVVVRVDIATVSLSLSLPSFHYCQCECCFVTHKCCRRSPCHDKMSERWATVKLVQYICCVTCCQLLQIYKWIEGERGVTLKGRERKRKKCQLNKSLYRASECPCLPLAHPAFFSSSQLMPGITFNPLDWSLSLSPLSEFLLHFFSLCAFLLTHSLFRVSFFTG